MGLPALLLLVALSGAAPATARPSLTDFIGPVTLHALDGRRVTASGLEGRVVLVDVWATWCAPCLAELPLLKSLHSSYPDDVSIVGINADSVPARDLRSWLSRRQIDWPQLFDGRGVGGPILDRLGITALPRTFLFDRRGTLIAVDLRGDALEAAITSMVHGSRR